MSSRPLGPPRRRSKRLTARPARDEARTTSGEPRSILVIRRDNIGDLVCTTPLLATLRARYPQAWIGVLANSYNAPALDGNPHVDEVLAILAGSAVAYHPFPGRPFDHPTKLAGSAADVEAELRRIGHTLQPLDIVVVNTRAGSRYGNNDYVSAGCGMGYEATMFLLERGVRLTGTDAWSWDAPFSYTAKKVAETGNKALIWEGHKAGRDIGYCHLEKLHNLEALPPHGFTISCFPHKIRGASAGWTRAVAIFEE